MGREVEPYRPTDPRAQAYAAGAELARQVGGAAELFDHPFFRQGQVKREITTKRSVHVVNDQEFVLTEETTQKEVFSFGDDLFS